jgi:hypothetical protein
MRYRSSEFDETQLLNLISNLMTFDEIHFVKFDEMLLIRNNEMLLVSSLISRFRHVWWVAFVKAFVISNKVESDNRNIDDEMIKHDHENEFTEIFLSKKKIWSRISRSHLTFRDKTQNTLLASSQQVASLERNMLSLLQKRERLSEEKQFIIVMFSKKKEIKNLKINKRLFSFIIACYFKNLNTIQSFREVKRRNRLTLKDFHRIFQDVIAARQKNLELDFDYNSSLFKLFSSVISDQFSRKSTFDLINDIDLFDLEVRSSSSLKSFNKSFDIHVSFKQLILFVNSSRIQSFHNQSFRNYERKH